LNNLSGFGEQNEKVVVHSPDSALLKKQIECLSAYPTVDTPKVQRYTASLATLYKKDKLLQGWSLCFDKPSFIAPRKSLPPDATDGGAVSVKMSTQNYYCRQFRLKIAWAGWPFLKDA
jgi:hypothetical protein